VTVDRGAAEELCPELLGRSAAVGLLFWSNGTWNLHFTARIRSTLMFQQGDINLHNNISDA
jgi:hypothetical protein